MATLSVLALALLATPAAAQRSGTVELGAFGRYTWFDNAVHLKDRVGFGGRLGIFVTPRFEVEGDVSHTATEDTIGNTVRYYPIHARLQYNQPVGPHGGVILGAGYTRNLFRKGYRETKSGVGGLFGIRLGSPNIVSIRIEGLVDYIPNAETKTGAGANKNNWHWGLQAGLSLMVPNPARQAPAPVAVAPPAPEKDTDGDGVMDSADRCPDTPAGDRVDASGCSLPKDSDGDGVMDNVDKCPDTPAGEKVDASGCPLPKDSDNDGVMDNVDKCPDTPAGDKVDASGCSLPKDSDNDGVMDPQDKCPNTPAGTQVDASGCPRIFEEGKTSVILEGVNFETNKAVLLPESQEVLDRVAASLVANPDVRVEVGGYTDSRGTRALNNRLSQARANAVREYLISKGVNPDNLVAKGYGPTNPVAPNTTAEGRAKNRRVELHRLSGEMGLLPR